MTLIKKEELNHMKYLKIEDNKGYFLKAGDSTPGEWIEIDKVNKDDLMKLLNKAVDTEFDMDEYSEEILGNKAHQIIYKRLYEKFNDLFPPKIHLKMKAKVYINPHLKNIAKKINQFKTYHQQK